MCARFRAVSLHRAGYNLNTFLFSTSCPLIFTRTFMELLLRTARHRAQRWGYKSEKKSRTPCRCGAHSAVNGTAGKQHRMNSDKVHEGEKGDLEHGAFFEWGMRGG